MTDEPDLAAFLLAMIAEDEEGARRESVWPNGAPKTEQDWQYVAGQADSMLVSMFSPARVLADCEARRAIVERLAAVVDDTINYDDMARNLADDILRLLGLSYSARPGYREEWKP